MAGFTGIVLVVESEASSRNPASCNLRHESAARFVCFAEPDDKSSCLAVYIAHSLDLSGLIGVVVLINAESVDLKTFAISEGLAGTVGNKKSSE